jgi:hypothetical protein
MNGMMDAKERKIVLELSEHDALQLLNLILKKMYQDHKPWRPYWKYLAQIVEQSIEGADCAPSLGADEIDPTESGNIRERQITNPL